MLSNAQRSKLKVFVKTYLYLKGKATTKELTIAVNECDIGLNIGITSSEMGRFLMSLTYRKNKNYMGTLKYEKNPKNARVYYLED